MQNPKVSFWNDPRMPYVETRQAFQSYTCYQAHSHDTFSLGAVNSGKSQFTSYLHKATWLAAGTVVSIPAHVEHACNPLKDQVWSYQMLYLDANWIQQLVNESITLDAKTSLPQLKPEIIKSPEIYQSVCKLNQILFDVAKTILEKEQVLMHTLAQIIFPALRWEKIIDSLYTQQHLNELIDILNQQEHFLSLEHLARQSGISRYAIIRLFKKNVGLTPHIYQLNLKINQARKRLKSQCSIAQLAFDLGFADQSHFSRVFKKMTGVTPRQFQMLKV